MISRMNVELMGCFIDYDVMGIKKKICILNYFKEPLQANNGSKVYSSLIHHVQQKMLLDSYGLANQLQHPPCQLKPLPQPHFFFII